MTCLFVFRSCNGRPLSREDWKRMNTEVAKLHIALGQIDLASTEDGRNAQTGRLEDITAMSATLGSDSAVEHEAIAETNLNRR
jgi:hypothetical protein